MKQQLGFRARNIALFLLSAGLTAAVFASFGRSFREARPNRPPAEFAGQLQLFANEPITSEGHIFHKALFSENGRRILFTVSGPDNVKRALLWEDGAGFTQVSAPGQYLSSDAAFSADGKRAAFIAANLQAESDQNFLYLWEEGFSAAPLIEGKFTGVWHVVLSRFGERLLLLPADDAARFEADGKSILQPLLLELGSRAAATQLVPGQTPSALPPVAVRHLEDSARISAALLSSGQINTLTGFDGSSLQLKHWRKPKHFLADDVDSDGGADLLVFSPGPDFPVWRSYMLNGADGPKPAVSQNFGRAAVWRVGDNRGIPVPGDYNGDGALDLAVYIPGMDDTWSEGRGNWLIYLSSPPSLKESRLLAPVERELRLYWGHTEARAMPADYDGDGATDIAVYFPTRSSWHLLLSRGGFNHPKAMLEDKGAGEQTIIGNPRGVPLAFDFDGNGCADLAIFDDPTDDRTAAKWKIRFIKNSHPGSRPDATIEFGLRGDIPIPGDYDGDGKAELAVYRPGTRTWYIRYAPGDIREIQWGIDKAHPLIADYNGDGQIDLAFFAPQGEYRYQILSSGFAGKAQEIMPGGRGVVTKLNWGLPEEVPVQLLLRRHQQGQ
ncbi:MAG TPA: VCBS repeat-containing protein [Oligoflexia bacterium]|nr:VCBS repeat-containing protein [Oligoflexia bacterium]